MSGVSGKTQQCTGDTTLIEKMGRLAIKRNRVISPFSECISCWGFFRLRLLRVVKKVPQGFRQSIFFEKSVSLTEILNNDYSLYFINERKISLSGLLSRGYPLTGICRVRCSPDRKRDNTNGFVRSQSICNRYPNVLLLLICYRSAPVRLYIENNNKSIRIFYVPSHNPDSGNISPAVSTA